MSHAYNLLHHEICEVSCIHEHISHISHLHHNRTVCLAAHPCILLVDTTQDHICDTPLLPSPTSCCGRLHDRGAACTTHAARHHGPVPLTAGATEPGLVIVAVHAPSTPHSATQQAHSVAAVVTLAPAREPPMHVSLYVRTRAVRQCRLDSHLEVAREGHATPAASSCAHCCLIVATHGSAQPRTCGSSGAWPCVCCTMHGHGRIGLPPARPIHRCNNPAAGRSQGGHHPPHQLQHLVPPLSQPAIYGNCLNPKPYTHCTMSRQRPSSSSSAQHTCLATTVHLKRP